ncbi:MAG: transposase [Euryarchaeota archaeon]|nr:transposase [Euryarchaeota archaeon]
MPKLQEIIGLKEVPHFTTLQKFFKRFGSHFFDEMLEQTVELFDIEKPWVAVDGTGHSCDQASLYYARKIEKQSKKWRKSYTKNQIAIDTQTQVILAHKVARGPRHDSKDAIPTIRKTRKYKPSGFSLDKAFDKEEIHRVIHEELEATSMIPPKKRVKNGKYRLSMQSLFSNPKYHLRSLVETVISVLKRVFDDKNQSRSDRLRNKETKLRNSCYNIYRYAKHLSIQNLKMISTEPFFCKFFT